MTLKNLESCEVGEMVIKSTRPSDYCLEVLYLIYGEKLCRTAVVKRLRERYNSDFINLNRVCQLEEKGLKSIAKTPEFKKYIISEFANRQQKTTSEKVN